MSAITRKYMDEMGETGAGITREDEINMDIKNSFTTKWGSYLCDTMSFQTTIKYFLPAIIKEACPWFFDMRELIAERPNQVPIGLGDSEIDYEISVMMGDASEPASGFTSDDIGHDGSFRDAPSDDWGSMEPADTGNAAPLMQETVSTGAQERKTGLQDAPQSLKPANRVPKNPAKKQKMEQFAEIAKVEEITRHKELDVAKAKVEKDTARAKIKLAKLELQKEKLAYARERRREKMQRRLTTMEGTSRQHGLHFSHSPIQEGTSQQHGLHFSHSPIQSAADATDIQSIPSLSHSSPFDPSSVIFPPHEYTSSTPSPGLL